MSNNNLNRPTRKISGSSKLAAMFAQPPVKRLPINPSRVDRLIFDSWRESSRTLVLLASVAQQDEAFFLQHENSNLAKWSEAIELVQKKRNEELINNLNRQRLGQPVTNDSGTSFFRSWALFSDFLFYFSSSLIREEVVALASSIHDLAKQTAKIRTLLWSLSTVMLEVHLTKDHAPTGTKEMSQSPPSNVLIKNLKIKTDLVEIQ